MTQEDAIRLAWGLVNANKIIVEGLEKAHFVTLPKVDEASISPDILETYLSVKSYFRDHWAVTFRRVIPPGVVENPATELISVYEDGRVIHELSL